MNLTNKEEVFYWFWGNTTTFYVTLVPGEGCDLPEMWRNAKRCTLQFGQNLPLAIKDLYVDGLYLKATLSFNREPYYVTIPWACVTAIHETGGDPLLVRFPSDNLVSKVTKVKPALRVV